jgi:hypothetical protein
MAKARPSDSRDRLAEPLSRVEITVRAQRGRPARRLRIVEGVLRRRPGTVAVLAGIAIVIGGVGAALFGGSTNGAHRATNADAREVGAAGVAAAYGYPLRCLSVTFDRRDAAYARADFNHAAPCGRYDGSATAIFHRVGGSWRMAVDALAYSCPVARIPRAVQPKLGVCP